jgi:hypothetical protein
VLQFGKKKGDAVEVGALHEQQLKDKGSEIDLFQLCGIVLIGVLLVEIKVDHIMVLPCTSPPHPTPPLLNGALRRVTLFSFRDLQLSIKTPRPRLSRINHILQIPKG